MGPDGLLSLPTCSSKSAFVLALVTARHPVPSSGSCLHSSQWPADRSPQSRAGQLQGGRQGSTHHVSGQDRSPRK